MTNISAKKKCGGKSNFGMSIKSDSKICAAGLPSAQPDQSVKGIFYSYCLQDQVDALLGDVIHPEVKTVHSPKLNRNNIRDMRNAGIFSEGSQLINPPVRSKFQTLVDDFKETAYNSYWNKDVGKAPDPVPSLPQGFKIYDTIVGERSKPNMNLYDVIMPINEEEDRTPKCKEPGYQINRNYVSFNRNSTFGKRSYSDKSGKLVKHCIDIDKIYLGTASKAPINEKQGHFQDATTSKLATPLTPNNNIQCVPEGFVFGKCRTIENDVPEYLSICETNSHKALINKCLGHLNNLRNTLAKRFDGPFFKTFYLNLKYLDESKSGWMEKEIIYKQCRLRYIRFNSSLIEPLLQVWNGLNGSHIKYETFIRAINYREPSPELPNIDDTLKELNNFKTTYGEMTTYEQILDTTYRAGVSSGRYFEKDYPLTPDGFCKADRSYFPEETDMKACLNPSIFTLLDVSHRDIYSKRDPSIIKKIFENAGEQFADEAFSEIWKIAEGYHSKKWVCLETFRRALIKYEMKNKTK